MEAAGIGKIALKRRKYLRLSQKIVCEGLFSPMTLCRFEKGKQMPPRDYVVAILQRLGLPEDRYFAHLTKRETELQLLRKDIMARYQFFEHALDENRQWARADALEALHKLECYIRKDDQINRQFILGMKSALEGISPQKRLEMRMEAIHLTCPRFDLNNLSRHLYSVSEVRIISKIAHTLADCGQREKAIDVYSQLMALLLERSPNHSCMPLVTYNYAVQLGLAERHEESLQIAEFGRKACIQQGWYNFLPAFLHSQAESCYHLDELDRSIELYQAAYYIYETIMDSRNQENLKADAKERFGLIF